MTSLQIDATHPPMTNMSKVKSPLDVGGRDRAIVLANMLLVRDIPFGVHHLGEEMYRFHVFADDEIKALDIVAALSSCGVDV